MWGDAEGGDVSEGRKNASGGWARWGPGMADKVGRSVRGGHGGGRASGCGLPQQARTRWAGWSIKPPPS